MDIVSYLLGKNSSGGSSSLQEKDITITENKLTQVTADSGYSGLSKVNITTNVPSASDYFNTTISDNTNNANIPTQILLKTPDIQVANNVTSLYLGFANSKMSIFPKITFGSNIQGVGSLFQGCSSATTIDCSGFNTTGVLVMSSMFESCSKLTSLDLSNFYTPNIANVYHMFYGCSSLQHLDIRNMTLSGITSSSSYQGMFGSVPNNCEIIVKDNVEKEWITSKFTNLTNVKTVAEL